MAVVKDMGRNMWSQGRGFAKVGALYSGFECVIEGVSWFEIRGLLCGLGEVGSGAELLRALGDRDGRSTATPSCWLAVRVGTSAHIFRHSQQKACASTCQVPHRRFGATWRACLPWPRSLPSHPRAINFLLRSSLLSKRNDDTLKSRRPGSVLSSDSQTTAQRGLRLHAPPSDRFPHPLFSLPPSPSIWCSQWLITSTAPRTTTGTALRAGSARARLWRATRGRGVACWAGWASRRSRLSSTCGCGRRRPRNPRPAL